MDLISVVVITYNSEETVVETLDSIYKQTYANIELIVTDDCSTDNTIEIVRNWIRKYQVRFIDVRLLKAKKNHGVTKNCNIGINQATGKYVQLIAGDDILLEHAIKSKYEFAEERKLDLVCSKVEVFGTDIQNVATMDRLCEKCFKIMKEDWKKQYENILKFNFVVGPMCGFYLLDYLKKKGGFDIRYPMLEDYPFMFHYIMAGNEIELLDEVLTRYRISDKSLSMKKDMAFNKSVAKFIGHEVIRELIRSRNFKGAMEKIKETF